MKKSSKSSWSWAVGSIFALVAVSLSLYSYNAKDPSLNTFSEQWSAPTNMLGYFGSWTSDLLLQFFGWAAWSIPVMLCLGLIRWFLAGDYYAKIFNARWWSALSLGVLSVSISVDLIDTNLASSSFPTQGIVGLFAGAFFKTLVGEIGTYLMAFVLAWSFCLVWWESLPALMARYFEYLHSYASMGIEFLWKFCVQGFSKATESIRNQLSKMYKQLKGPKIKGDETNYSRISAKVREPEEVEYEEEYDDADEEETELVINERSEIPAPKSLSSREKKPVKPPVERPEYWELPDLSLLATPIRKTKPLSKEQLRATAKKIQFALESFDIDGEVVEISPGPIITMYEFQPAAGIRVNKIVSVSTDLAMSLGVPSVRIVAPIPGKSVAGIEVPNEDKEDIVLRDVFELTKDRADSMKLPLVMGKDGEGNPIVEDLSRMPHLLIGGATSMGKSVLVNSILTSLLMRFTPDELRLIVVDPKLVEFKIYEDIPHLMLPIVNDPNDASQALKWAVSETKKRYLMMQKVSAKNLEAYNKKIEEMDFEDEEEEELEAFPHIVIIVDELAELMLTAKKDVENSIVRLTQLARAAGIHLIMATQRPSADVVTGLIKSNCPSRASLRVASASDSRIILDCAGAEQLLGKGDMFFTNTGPMGLRRMQGCFVSDEEVEAVCDSWREQGEPEYCESILAPEVDMLDDDESRDQLFGDVVSFARERGVISTSLIQRKFSIGYTRAARIMEQLEGAGIVGEQTSAGKPRDVLA